jgi:hypothetical protein
MAEQPPSPENEPNFVFGGARVISEANWSEYEAQGVRNVVDAIPPEDENALRDELERKGRSYGTGNLLLGDAFDQEASRPLHLKPGIGVYVTAEGRKRYQSQAGSKPKRPPVMLLPDGTAIVARPGVRFSMKHSPEAGTHDKR